MKFRSVFTLAFICALLGAGSFALMAWLVGDGRIAAFDSAIIDAVQARESAGLTSVMKFFTWIGAGIPVVVITVGVMAVLYLLLGHRKELWLYIGVSIGSALLNTVLKAVFHRARPTLHRIAEATGYSFPSGHSMAAFSLYGILAFLLWKHTASAFGRTILLIVCTLFIFMIGISRIYLGVHYPSDVVGGYLASGCWLAACIWFYQLYLEKRYEAGKKSANRG